MLNHETGQMNWDRYPIGGSSLPSSSYYASPENMYDLSTPRGRELMDQVLPSVEESQIAEGTNGWVVVFVLILLVLAFFIVPFNS